MAYGERDLTDLDLLRQTIVDLSGARPCLLRPGALAAEEIEMVIGQRLVPRTKYLK